MANLYENLINLDLNYQITDSNNFLDILFLELKIYKAKLIILENNKPYWFQKQKLKKYNEEKQELENKINNYKIKIKEELELVAKMEKTTSF